jgi:hypothetical protein
MPSWENVVQRLGLAPGPRPPRLKPRLPMTAAHVSAGHVSAVRLGGAAPGKRGSAERPRVVAHAEVEIPGGASLSFTGPSQLLDLAPLARAIESVLAAVAPRETRISVVLPDPAARVSLLKFGRLPATRQEVADLIRFRMQKVLPFRVEEASLDFQLLSEADGEETEFLAVLIQRPVLFQFERLFSARDRLPGLVDLESFNLANLLARAGGAGAEEAGDRALVNAASGYLTVLYFRNGLLNFYRCKPLADEERALPERLHGALRREMASCAAYYREHLAGAGFSEAVVRVVEGDPAVVLGIVQEEMGCRARTLDPSRAAALPGGADPSDPRWQRLAPALGAALGRAA